MAYQEENILERRSRSNDAPRRKPEHLRVVHLGLGWIGDSAGGLERYQDGLCRQLTREGVPLEAWVVRPEDGPHDAIYPVRAFAPSDAPRRQKRCLLRDCFATHRHRIDVLVSHHVAHAALLGKGLGQLPHVVHFHGPWASESAAAGEPGWKAYLKFREERHVYRTADRLITLSQGFKNILIEDYGVDEERIHVIPGGIDCDQFDPGVDRAEARRRLGWHPAAPIAVSIRRLTPRMGLDSLIDSMPAVLGSLPEARLYIGGTGPIRDALAARIAERGLGERVKLLGFVPAEELPLVYAAADVSIVPSRALEGFGLVCLESLAAGTPVLVTPVGGLPEVVTGLDASLVLRSSSSEDLAAGLIRGLTRPTPLPSPSQCRAYVRHRYNWSLAAERVLEVYREAAESRKGSI